MKTLSILAIILTSFITTSAYAVDTPMQCNLTCKTDYAVSAGMQVDAESESDAANPLAPAKSVMYTNGQPSINDLIATQNSSTGDFDFVTECVQYQGRFWEWRRSKCLSLNPNWNAPALGTTNK